MSRIEEFLDIFQAEQSSGIRADNLRKSCRTGKLSARRVAGRTGPWLILPADLAAYSKKYFSKPKFEGSHV